MSAPEAIALEGGGRVVLYREWLAREDADAAFAALMETTPWAQKDIVMFGERVAQPRLVAWMGEEDATYTYSGLTQHPMPFTPAVAQLRERVEATTHQSFNGVLLNLYRHGQDSMGFHADDEPELGPDPVIASVSLGATRRFDFKSRKGPKRTTRLLLEHGSLLVMEAGVQRAWHHGVPKEPSVHAPRVNLTFRRITRAGRTL